MMPPEAQGMDENFVAAPKPSAVLLCPPVRPVTLQQRADFLRTAQGRRQAVAGFLLQARDRGDGDPMVRVGFTCSKKVGNAVTRNRAKRRLRALARQVLPSAALPGWDYVLVGRPEATVARGFSDLLADLGAALRQVHRGKRP